MTATMTAHTSIATFLWPVDESGRAARSGTPLALEMSTRLHEFLQDVDVIVPEDVDDPGEWRRLYRLFAEGTYQGLVSDVFGNGLLPEGFVFSCQLPDGRYVVTGPTRFAEFVSRTAITDVPVAV